MGFPPQVCQVQAGGKSLQLISSQILLIGASSGRAVFSSNHEMGRAAVQRDSTSVCNACDWLVVGHLYYLRTTLAAVILDYMGLYCEASLSPGWGHLYVSCFNIGSKKRC